PTRSQSAAARDCANTAGSASVAKSNGSASSSTCAQSVAVCCGSTSTTSTRRSLASTAARFIAVVVLPTPPFWFTTATILAGIGLSFLVIGPGDAVVGPPWPAHGSALVLVARDHDPLAPSRVCEAVGVEPCR